MILERVFPHAELKESYLNHNACLANKKGGGSLGKPDKLSKFIAYTRNGPWLKPITGPNMDDGRPLVAIAFQRTDGLNVTVESVWKSGKSQSHLKFSENGINVEVNDGDEDYDAAVIVGISKEFKGFFWRLDPNVTSENPTPNSSWFEGPVYCTWNAMGTSVSESLILEYVDDLLESDIAPTTVIIDDGWQDVTPARELNSNTPERAKFPKGLQSTVKRLKKRGVSHIFIWTAVAGYWNGVSDKYDGDYETIEARLGGRQVKIFTPKSVRKYYLDFFNALKKSGVTGVKLDNLNFLDEIELKDKAAKRHLQTAYYKAFTHALEATGLDVIWSMSMVPYMLTVSLRGIPRGPSVAGVLRNSDDYFPDVEQSHFWHIYCNVYNALYARHFSKVLDFDMFQTKTPNGQPNRFPALHAVLRAISGGPIYLTDPKGTHDYGLFKQLVYGRKQRVFSFKTPPTPLDPYQSFGEGKLLRVFNSNKHSGVLVLFNLYNKPLDEVVDVPCGKVARSYNQASICSMSKTSGQEGWELVNTIGVSVLPGDFELVTFVDEFEWSRHRAAVFGYIDKYVGVLAISKVHVGSSLVLSLKEGGGQLGVYLAGAPDVLVFIEGGGHCYEYRDELLTVKIPNWGKRVEIQLLKE